MKYELYGMLECTDDNEYIIKDGSTEINISQILYEAYYWDSANADFPLVKFKMNDDKKSIIDVQGEMYLCKNDYKFYSFHIDDRDVDKALIDSVGKYVIIEIKILD